MGKADLHIHTTYSYDSSVTVSGALDWAASFTDMDVIAVTDHDRIEGALEARQRAAEFGIEVVPGVEITSREGHVLALFVEKTVPRGLTLLETILRVGDLGGICVVAHPCAFMVHGADEKTIRQVFEHPEASKTLVGIESLNTGLWFPKSNEVAKKLAEDLGVAQTGGSDSHLYWTIGFGYTEFAGNSALDLRMALEARATTSHKSYDRRSLGYYAGHFLHRAIRELGWATWAPEPNSDLVLRRLSDVQGNI